MYVQGSTVSLGYLSGHGVIDAYGGSTIKTNGSATSGTIELDASNLAIGGAIGTRPLFIGPPGGFGEYPGAANLPGDPPFGMAFGAHISMDGASEIWLTNTSATSEVFHKTSMNAGELFLYYGKTPVAELGITLTGGATNLYAQNVLGNMRGPEVVLSIYENHKSIPYHVT